MASRFLEVVAKNSRVQPWQLRFEKSFAFPDVLEHHASKLLNELIFHIAHLRANELFARRETIEKIVEQIHAEGVKTIHGAIIWCYRDIEAFLR